MPGTSGGTAEGEGGQPQLLQPQGTPAEVQEQPSPSVLMALVPPPTASCQTKHPSLGSCVKIRS